MLKKMPQLPIGEGTTLRRTFVKGVTMAPVVGGLLVQTLLVGSVIAHAQAQKNGAHRIDTFAIGSDSAIWHKWFDNGVWSDWESLGGLFLNPPAVTSWDTGRLDIFVRGTDKALWHKWFDNGVWSNWESLGGVLYSDPAVCSWGTGRLDVFAGNSDAGLSHKSYDAGQWSDWQTIYRASPVGNGHAPDGRLAGIPAAVSWGPGRIDVFFRLFTTTPPLVHPSVVHKWFDNGQWNIFYENIGGNFTRGTSPAAVSWHADRWDVFPVNDQGKLSYKTSTTGRSGSHDPWSDLNSSMSNIIESHITVSSGGPGRFDVLILGNDSTLQHMWFDNGQWSGVSAWDNLGSVLNSTPAMVGW